MTPLSAKLRALLVAKQIKQGFLAERLHKHPSDISHIMRGTLRPNDELLLAIINELDLSRKEAEELVTSGNYPPSLLDRLHPDFSHYPPIDEPKKIEQYLRGDLGRIPVWRLDNHARIIELNLLSAYLWNGLNISERQLTLEKLLGKCVFWIYAQEEHFKRIAPPLYEHDMLAIKPLTFKLMEEDLEEETVKAFHKLIQESVVIRLIYEHSRLEGGKEWDYTLRIRPPERGEEGPYLTFSNKVMRIMEGDKHTGFLIIGQPSGTYTIDFMQRKYYEIVEAFRGESFVQPPESEPVAELVHPSFYPQLELDPLLYVTRENNTLQLVLQQSIEGAFLIDLFLFERVQDLLGPRLVDTAVGAIKDFLYLTQDYQSEEHPFHKGFMKVYTYLFSNPMRFRKFLDAMSPTPSLFAEGNKKPHEGEILCVLRFQCRYTDNMLLALNTRYYKKRRGNSHLLVLQPANTETNAALILYHLEALGITAAGSVGETPFDQYIWFLAVLSTVLAGLSEGVSNSSWVPEAAFAAADKGWRRYNFPVEMQEAGAQSQVQALLYQLYFRQHTSSRVALLELFRGFCCMVGAEYITDYLSHPPRTQPAPVPAPAPIDAMVREVPHRNMNGGVVYYLAGEE